MQIAIDLLLLWSILVGINEHSCHCLMGWILTFGGGPRQIARPILNLPKSQHGLRSFFSINENLAFSR